MREGYIKTYNAILVAICKFIKFAIYIPTRKDINAAELINLLLGYIIKIYGYFQVWISDRDSVFSSDFYGAFCFFMKVRRRLSIAFHS
jgi:hypothetical protein